MSALDWRSLLVICSFVLLLTHKFWLPSFLELVQGRKITIADKEYGVSVKEGESTASSSAVISSQVSPTKYRVSVKNSSSLSDAEIGAAVLALQTQLHRDFAPAWGVDAELELLPRGAEPPSGAWVLLVGDRSDVGEFISYHTLTNEGLPMAKVFVKTAFDNGFSWTLAASHELLEMLADSGSNLTVFRQADEKTGRLYKRQICDPCLADKFGYRIDGTLVSDFVFPAWFQESSTPSNLQFDQGRYITAPFMSLPGSAVSIFEVTSGSGWIRGGQQATQSKPKRRSG
jgi:hypothetical protein